MRPEPGVAIVPQPPAVFGSSAGLLVGVAVGVAVVLPASAATLTENVPLPVWPTASVAVQVIET